MTFTNMTPRMLFIQVLFLALTMMLQLQSSHGKALRSIQKNVSTRSYNDNSIRDNNINITFPYQIEMKNTCQDANLNIHVRYYDGGNLKYSISNNVHLDQKVVVSTDAKVILVLVGAETTRDGRDIYREKCDQEERNYLR